MPTLLNKAEFKRRALQYASSRFKPPTRVSEEYFQEYEELIDARMRREALTRNSHGKTIYPEIRKKETRDSETEN